MKKLWTKAATGAAVMALAGAANAYVLDFESVVYSDTAAAPLLAADDYVTQGGFFAQAQDRTNATASYLSGAIINGADAGSCLNNICPGGNSTRYIASVNDAVVRVGAVADNTSVTISSFSAAYLSASAAALPSGTVLYLAVEADRTDNSYAQGLFRLTVPDANGATTFNTFSTAAGNYTLNSGSGTLTSGSITDYYFYAFYCSSSGCSSASNKAQFALDNINITAAVPEPSEWLLMAAGLGLVGGLATRRRSV